ncbi:RNA polymerase sigma factor [Coralloluteibacterium stylophorae]|uniref:RNA polymerase sigma factor n=1 Tax=Coralloluteibacterium stylophorae TaxID=1776034 RepID=A0A8J7VUP1_9GAMM|nr:RNA polymerase sigma factor [Coralloluteibacterium stylophorae]MBS7458945.1 RNA polymerase sigma factor [Coralloluteibacterium stylophorae]
MKDTDGALDEAALLRRARRGDAQAFGMLYRLHARPIYALALRLTGQAAAAEDVVQETFLKAMQAMSGFREGAPMRPWLKRMAANAAIDRLRAERRLRPLEDVFAETQDAAEAAPSAVAEALGLLARLDPEARALVWLQQMEGWTHAELAQRFGRSESWSKSILSRALQRLRSELDEEDDRHA